MSLIASLMANTSESVSDLLNPALWLSDWSSGGRTSSGEPVTHDRAFALSPYWASIRNISEDIGKISLITYRRLPNGTKIRLMSDPRFKMLHDQPNPEMDAMSFRETLTHHMLGWGNGFAEIVRDGSGRARELWPIHPSRVEPKRDEDRRLFYRVHMNASGLSRDNSFEAVDIPASDILHIHGLGPDGIVGYSVLRLASECLGLGLAAQTFGAAFFGNGAHISGVLTHPGKLSTEGRARLREEWAKMHQGASRANKLAILQEGMEWKATGIPPEEAQFLMTRTFQVADIARWFRIQPHKIGDLARSTNNNIEHQSIEYVGDTLASPAARWENQLNLKIFPEPDIFAEHLLESLLRGDAKARGELYRKRFETGSISPNEIRALENDGPIDGGDIYFRPGNLVPLGEPDPPNPAQTPRSRQGTNVSVMLPLLEAAIGKLLKAEATAARRLAKKHAGDPARFSEEIRKFMERHREHVEADVAPPAVALASLAESKADAGEVCRRYAEAHVGRSIQDLIVNFSDVDGVIDNWTSSRASVAAAELAEAIT